MFFKVPKKIVRLLTKMDSCHSGSFFPVFETNASTTTMRMEDVLGTYTYSIGNEKKETIKILKTKWYVPS